MPASDFKKILVACNSRGRMLDICLRHASVRDRIWGVFSDHDSESLEVADRHALRRLSHRETDNELLSDALSALCDDHGVDYIISTGYTRIFKGRIFDRYGGRILNTHFSLLPAFPGTKASDWTTSRHPPKAIFERAMTYGSRIIGNTIHLVDRSIDGGYPVMQSSLAVPYDQPVATIRHRLFLQECQMFMQMVIWLTEGRLSVFGASPPRISQARFDTSCFSPAVEESWIENFTLARET